MKKINKLLDSKVAKYLIIPLALFGLWFILTFIYISTFESISIVPYNHKNVLAEHVNKPLLEGQKITGTITAQENNLGILAIRFELRSRVPYLREDQLVFRIKERGEENWYYENTYRSGFTYELPFLPFGFPVIADSQGKEYYFELISLKGDTQNAVIVDNKYPRLQSKYVVDKEKLKTDPSFLLSFIRQKYIGSFDNPSILFSSFIYALPFLFYLFWIVNPRHKLFLFIHLKYRKIDKLLRSNNSISKFLSDFNKVSIHGYIFLTILLLIILYDIFIIQLINDTVYLIMIGLWVGLTRIFAIKSQITFIVGIVFILITSITNTLMLEALAVKSADWAYMFLVAGLILLVLDIRKQEQSEKKSIVRRKK